MGDVLIAGVVRFFFSFFFRKSWATVEVISSGYIRRSQGGPAARRSFRSKLGEGSVPRSALHDDMK